MLTAIILISVLDVAEKFRSEDLFAEMKVKAVFKGVTYELLTDPEFMRVVARQMPLVEELHEEFEAAKAHA
jgi:hypothetical protein